MYLQKKFGFPNNFIKSRRRLNDVLYICTRLIRIRTELRSHLGAASSASLDDETDTVFGHMKTKCCKGISFLSPICSPTGEAKVSHSLVPLSWDTVLGQVVITVMR
jgi:hypothetical protein